MKVAPGGTFDVAFEGYYLESVTPAVHCVEGACGPVDAPLSCGRFRVLDDVIGQIGVGFLTEVWCPNPDCDCEAPQGSWCSLPTWVDFHLNDVTEVTIDGVSTATGIVLRIE